MLKNLYIENIAVIERADIDFAEGLSVLSGETGAGKSIMIDAINAILGSRVSRELIRTGESRACVAAVFCGLSLDAAAAAKDMGITLEEDALLLRRELFSDGRNSCRINGQPATLSMLKALGQHLINIHGQHDGQHLMNELLHIDYLDAFGHLEEPLAEYLQHYEELLHLNRRMKALSMSAAEKDHRRMRLPEQIAELEKADVRPGEQEELLQLRLQLQNSEKIVSSLADAAHLMDGDEEHVGAAAKLALAEASLRSGARYSASAGELEKRLHELAVLAGDLSMDLADTLSKLDYAPQKLEDTEQRLALIARLSAKYGVSSDELSEHAAALTAELEALDSLDDSLDELAAQYAAKRTQLYEQAGALHDLRLQAGKRMAEKILRELSQLDMKNARFYVDVDDQRSEAQTRFTKKGTDTVRFLLSANAGEDLKPLAKVASGGELSRMMLAIKNVLSEGEAGVTAIFDEVDAGVSGRAASRVGEKLYAISQGRQVLCVTHLPQISCLADHQYHITKDSRDGRTFTRIDLLDEKGRIQEIARMNAGLHITQATLDSARELLAQANTYKKSLTQPDSTAIM